MSQQGYRQASVRAVTGTSGDYNSDWMALFDQAGIAPGDFDGRFLQWLNLKLSAAYVNLPEAMQALATANGAYNWSSLGTFDASIGPPSADPLAEALEAGETAGWLVSSYFLPLDDPDQYLTLAGADVSLWTAAYGTQKVDLAVETAAPQWDATLYSSKGGVTFNGTTQRLLGTGNVTNWPPSTDDLWLVVACRQDLAGSDATNRVAFEYGGNTAGTPRVRGVRRVQSGANNRLSIHVGNTAVSGASDFSGSHVVGGKIDIGGTSFPYFDGVADSAGTATASAALNLTRVRMGARADPVAASGFWSGAVVAAAVLNATATQTNFDDLTDLFAERLT